MNLKRCLFASLLALTSVGTAAAMGVTTQDPAAAHAVIDSGNHDGGGSNTDPTLSNHDCAPPASDGSSDGNDAGGTGGSVPHPRASHRNNRGWQSLLPGSIQ